MCRIKDILSRLLDGKQTNSSIIKHCNLKWNRWEICLQQHTTTYVWQWDRESNTEHLAPSHACSIILQLDNESYNKLINKPKLGVWARIFVFTPWKSTMIKTYHYKNIWSTKLFVIKALNNIIQQYWTLIVGDHRKQHTPI